MKRLYALIIAAALCFPSIGAWAWWQSIQQVSVAAAPSFSLTKTDSGVDASAGTTITFTGKSFGATSANRRIIVAFFGRTNNTAITSVTVGGVNATAVSGAAAINTNTTISNLYLSDSDPAGTSGNVVVTGPIAINRSGICVYRLISATTAGQGPPTNAVSLATTSLNTTLTVPASGKGITVYGNRDTPGNATWTNATLDFGGDLTGGGNISCASLTGTGSVTVTGTDGNGTPTSNEATMSTAAWGP